MFRYIKSNCFNSDIRISISGLSSFTLLLPWLHHICSVLMNSYGFVSQLPSLVEIGLLETRNLKNGRKLKYS